MQNRNFINNTSKEYSLDISLGISHKGLCNHIDYLQRLNKEKKPKRTLAVNLVSSFQSQFTQLLIIFLVNNNNKYHLTILAYSDDRTFANFEYEC